MLGTKEKFLSKQEDLADQSQDSFYQAALTRHRNGDLDGAEHDYRTILVTRPDHAGAWHFLGVVLHAKNRPEEALEHFQKALSLCATNPIYHNNYGVLLKDLGRMDEALFSFIKAVELDPNYADAHSNLGCIRLIRNESDDAEREISAALAIDPEHSDARKLLRDLRFRQGNLFAAEERFHDAGRVFHQAASLPGGRELWRWKSLGFCPAIFSDENSIEVYWHKLNAGLDLALQSDIPVDWRSLPRDGFTPSFNLPHLDRCCRDTKEKFAKIFEKHFPPVKSRPGKPGSKRIRVGFVVTSGHHRGFLRVHRHLLEHLDPKRFELFFICPAEIVEPCRSAFTRPDITWVRLPNSFEKSVHMLRETRCDILYHWKVGGGVLDYFLAMAKAAPIQCTSYGTHGTCGVSGIDYYISSKILESPESASQYTEELVLLDSYATSHEHEKPAPAASREELGIPGTGALYFCPHRLPKYHPRFDHYFRTILEKDTSGRLVLLTGKRKHPAGIFVERLRRSLGPALFKRVHLLPGLSPETYKKHLAVATCVLDSPVYAGDLTTHDAFDLGVPVVAHEGSLLVQSYTSGLYRLMGLESLVASDVESYSNLAVRLGTNPDYRNEISRILLERNAPVFSPDDTVRDYERFFESVFDRR